jgi:hypothetical protein
VNNVTLVRLSFLATALLSSVALADNAMTMRAEAADPWLGSLSWKMPTSTSNLSSDVLRRGNEFRWKFTPFGTINNYGNLESVAFPGYCLKASGSRPGSGVILATCDFKGNDKAQVWISTLERKHDSRGWYSFKPFAYFSTNMCMQGANAPSPITLQDCNNPPGPNQVWSVFNELQGIFMTDVTAFSR